MVHKATTNRSLRDDSADDCDKGADLDDDDKHNKLSQVASWAGDSHHWV